MTHEDFKKLLEELDGNASGTLAEKNARYSSSDDALHNFKSGAEITGGTPAQACWGYLTKHLVALRDMIDRNDFSNREDFLEKIQDSMNYLRFIWALGNETNSNKENKQDGKCTTEYPINESGYVNCKKCRFENHEFDEEPCRYCRGIYSPSSARYVNEDSYYQEKI